MKEGCGQGSCGATRAGAYRTMADHDASSTVVAASPRKRKSSGFDLLWSEMDTLSPSARQELTNMIGGGGGRRYNNKNATATNKQQQRPTKSDSSGIGASASQNDYDNTARNSSSNDNNHGARRARDKKRVVVTSSMRDDGILDLVAQSKASLLGSICFLFCNSNTEVNNKDVTGAAGDVRSKSGAGTIAGVALSAMQVVKQCGLAVDPLHSPGRMDARDVVLAALYFLCETSYLKRTGAVTTINTTTTTTAATSSTATTSTAADLLKQSYEKAYDWQWAEVQDDAMGELEEAFYRDDPGHYDYLSRKRFLPASFDNARHHSDNEAGSSDKGRFHLLLKGVVPPTADTTTTKTAAAQRLHEIVVEK
jgi:hypothetical protein